MSWQPEIDELRKREALAKKMGGPEKVKRQHDGGKLTVRTIPWSDVYLGDQKLGQAPFADLDLPAGTYTLEFKNPAHPPVKRTVTIEPNKTTKVSFDF